MKISKKQIIEMIIVLEAAVKRLPEVWSDKHITEDIDDKTRIIFSDYGANDYIVSLLKEIDNRIIELSIVLKKRQPIEKYGLHISTKKTDYYTTIKRGQNLNDVRHFIIDKGEYD